jgi:hypothetical protein
MSREATKNNIREHIAYLAARIMAEGGIEDHALAKRKAARQAGAVDARQLPDNEEIDAALRTYRLLYQKQHPLQLRELRLLAVEIMGEFLRFDPRLTGPVLNGNASQFADIELLLFAESSKQVELDLLNGGLRYQTAEKCFYAGEMPAEAVEFSFEREAVTVRLAVLTPREQRTRLKKSPGGKPLDQANLGAVEQLLAQQEI